MDGWRDRFRPTESCLCVEYAYVQCYIRIHVLGHYANSMVIVLKDMQIPMFSCFSVKDNWL